MQIDRHTGAGLARWPRGPAGLVSALALACAGLAGCDSEEPPGCAVSGAIPLASTPLTALERVRLDRHAEGFALVGLEPGAVRWAAMDATGALARETVLPLPPHVAGPWVGLVGKSAAADQLVVVLGLQRGAGPIELQVLVQDAGGAASAPAKLVDLPAGADPKALRAAMGTAASGRRAAFAWGFEGSNAPPQLVVFGAGGEATAPVPLKDLSRSWRCLGMIPSRAPFGVGVLARAADGTTAWEFAEVREDASIQLVGGLPLGERGAECPAVAPSRKGYALAWTNRDGAFFAELDIMRRAGQPTLVAGAVRFGGPARLPRTAAIAPMGKDFALFLERPGRAEVWRLDYAARREGGALLLPGGLQPSVSVVPGLDVAHATYLTGRPGVGGPPDGGATSAGRQRQLVKVECPGGV